MARNTNRQGANFELAVMADLEARGYTCLRSSGSRGAVDVVAVWDDMGVLGAVMNAGQHLVFIQCKITNPLIPPHERLNVMRLSLVALAVPVVAYKEKLPGNRVKISYRELTGTGPKEWREWVPPEQTRRDDADE